MKLVSKIRRTCVWAACVGLALLVAYSPVRAGGWELPKCVWLQSQEFTKTIKKEFPLNASGNLSLVNKYGKVDVQTWEKDRVKIDVTIVVKAGSESAAQEVFNRISVDFINDANSVKAETVIESNSGNWWNWGGGNRTEFQINYAVFMPATASLDLSNKYGDASVAALEGRTAVNVSYGNFKLDGVGGNLAVNLGYGNGTVVRAKDVSADVSYSKIVFNDVQNVDFTSKYSKITVEKGVDVKAESRYDHFNLPKVRQFKHSSRYGDVEIGSAESVIALSRYTDYRIERLGDNGEFDLQYGGLQVDNLAKGFSAMNLVGKYSDFKIAVEPGASYTMDAAANYAGIGYPTNFNVSFEKEKGTSHEVKGHAGTQGARSVIKANLSYGSLKVRQ